MGSFRLIGVLFLPILGPRARHSARAVVSLALCSRKNLPLLHQGEDSSPLPAGWTRRNLAVGMRPAVLRRRCRAVWPREFAQVAGALSCRGSFLLWQRALVECSLHLTRQATRVLSQRWGRHSCRQCLAPRARRSARLRRHAVNRCTQHHCTQHRCTQQPLHATIHQVQLVTPRCGQEQVRRAAATRASLLARRRRLPTARVPLAPRRQQQQSAAGVSADVLRARSQAPFSGPGAAHSLGLAGRRTCGRPSEKSGLHGGDRSRLRRAAVQQVVHVLPCSVSRVGCFVAYPPHGGPGRRLTARSLRRRPWMRRGPFLGRPYALAR